MYNNDLFFMSYLNLYTRMVYVLCVCYAHTCINITADLWLLRHRHCLSQASSVKKFMCPVCNASIIHTMQNIKRHMRELHSDGQPHTCSTCSRTYDSYHKLQRHLKSHGDTGGICHVCGKVRPKKMDCVCACATTTFTSPPPPHPFHHHHHP